MDYKNTIITPKTAFPMKAGLPNREPGMLEKWNEMDLYGQLLEKNQDCPRFILHDGPPFSNGDIHMGHALNKTLKDFIVRARAMQGYYTPYVPGWDNHGMPIESAIIKKNKLNHKTMPVPEFRSACEQFAQDYIDRQREGFRRLGVIGDWAHPYKTMDKAFEAEEVKIFGAMYRKGYIYKGLKPVYWCPKDETALAEAEIEYADDACTSIYVKFALNQDFGKLAPFGGVANTYVIIWTTTPWTLPGNLAIAFHPTEEYVLLDAGAERYIVAKALAEKTMQAGGVDRYETVATFPGGFFERMTARHPFLDRDSLLVTADYVTMDSGTGCVHTAPGFGADDYQTCRRYDMDLVVPVDDRGYQTKEAGKYAGMYYAESNGAILADMKESGALFASEEMVHSYPHCWRCKSPIIFRATPQWFCSVESFKDRAIAACEEVQWFPAWGKDRMIAMLRERADWCISRQRRWGMPIPVFYCKHCGKPICTEETIAHISRLFGESGSNIWFQKEAMELIPEGLTCPHCGGKDFEKETDTLDGWFDSGSTHFASLYHDNAAQWPADVYLEGADQYRGWFQAALLTAVGSTGVAQAPFKTCITHGWTVDGEGKAMHKSLGNGVDPYDIMNKYGADLIRLWAASADYHADMRCSEKIFKQLSQNYLKFRNTARYCLGNLNGFDPNHLVAPADMLPLDRWAVTRLNVLIEKCFQGYDDFDFNVVTHAVNDFCVVELSNFYLDIIKDRLYCEEKDGLARRSAQTALYFILDTMTKIMAPVLCFTGDEIWQSMTHPEGADGRNVVFNDMNQPFTAYALPQEEMARWEKIIQVRDVVNGALETARAEKKIGKSLEAKIVLTVPAEDAFLAEMDQADLADLLIVSQVEVTVGQAIQATVENAAGDKCQRCWKVLPTVNGEGLCPRCAKVLTPLV